jgi:hypothetical protein
MTIAGGSGVGAEALGSAGSNELVGISWVPSATGDAEEPPAALVMIWV